jgi:hypothetical protein
MGARTEESSATNKLGGKRKQLFTEREARRLLRAAKAEGEKCILRKRPDGTLELVPMTGETDGSESTTPLSPLVKRRGQG